MKNIHGNDVGIKRLDLGILHLKHIQPEKNTCVKQLNSHKTIKRKDEFLNKNLCHWSREDF